MTQQTNTSAVSLPIKTDRSSNLRKAKAAKNDEFYTQINDIEKELKHYRDHFKDKVVFCNCDDPEWSKFWKHLSQKFNDYGLKKLISTHYDANNTSYKLELSASGLVKTDLTGDGDFRSDECLALLNECDIVITNPPFSLFREYVAVLVAAGKQFLIIGSTNALTYKETFKLIKETKLWIGVSPRSMSFVKPDSSIIDVNANWYTNMDHSKRHEDIDLFRKYDPITYPTYDNYDLLSDHFQYKSQLVLNDISCKADYLTFINATLKAIADSEVNVQAELGRYGHLGDCVIVMRGDSMSIPDVILAKVENNHLTLLEVIIAPNIEQIKRSGLFPK